jgi:hypothetical protein
MSKNDDRYPSDYGKNNEFEDFAETMWRWMNQPEWLATNAPARYGFFKEVFGG